MFRPQRKKRAGNTVTDQDDDSTYFLLRFKEDSQLQVTREHLVRNTASGKIIGLWFPNGRWYEAEILARGDKKSMDELKRVTIKPIPEHQNIVHEYEQRTIPMTCTIFEGKKQLAEHDKKIFGNTTSGLTIESDFKVASLTSQISPEQEIISDQTEESHYQPSSNSVLSQENNVLARENSQHTNETSRKAKRKAAENVSYMDQFDFEQLDFSPDEIEYDPNEDNETSEEDISESDNDQTTFALANDLYEPLHTVNTTSEVPIVRDTSSTIPAATSEATPNGLLIDLSKKKQNGKRQYDKRYMCKYCRNSYLKLPRHLEDKHAGEIEVAAYLAMPVGNKERKMKIEKIRLEGEKMFNFISYSSNQEKATLITKRRPSKEENARNYLPCEYCGGLFKKSYLARHVRQCNHRPPPSGNNQQASTRNIGLQSRAVLLLPTAPDVPPKFRECILEKMMYDDIYSEIVGDSLILEFGKKLFETKKKRPSQHREVKDRMRELARVLIAAKKISKKVNQLVDLIDPTMYNIIVEATKIVAGYDDNSGNYESPSLALKIGQSLKKCAFKYKGMCLDDEILHINLRKIELFEQRLSENWTDDAARDAHTTLQERQWNSPKRIPLTEDVTKLHKYLLAQEDCLMKEFQSCSNRSITSFRKLCENTLCRVILLNRRRVGEAQHIKLSDYNRATSNAPREDSEILETLSEVEKVLVKSLLRVEIRGKRGRMVPVILTPSIQGALNMLIDSRRSVGVDPTNDYLFPAMHSTKGHYRADVILRNAAKSCGAAHPSALTGTQLRRHIATTMQLLNLRGNELDAVANFLGHDIRVHRQYYRLPHETMQLAKISKLLINMETGNLNNMRGRNLDEINVEDDVVDDIEEPIAEDEDDPEVFCTSQQESNQVETTRPHLKRKFAGKKREKFSPEESKLIQDYFKKFIMEQKVPCHNDVTKFYLKYPAMKTINWTRVKFHIYNKFAGKKKK